MKKILLCLMVGVSAWVVQGCVAPYAALKGDYPQKIYWRDSSRSFDESFDKVVEYLIEQGYEPEETDRANGIIKMSGILYWNQLTRENKKGAPTSPKRAAVSPYDAPAVFSLLSKVIIVIRPTQGGSKIGSKLMIKAFDPIMDSRVHSEVATLSNLEKTIVDGIIDYK